MPKIISSPLGLKNRLKKPSRDIDTLPLLTVLFIALLFTLFSSKFIFAPGITVNINEANAESEQNISLNKNTTPASQALTLPISSQPLSGVEINSVLTIKNDSMFIFDGHIYDSLEKALQKKHTGTLLVKIGRNTSTQILFDLSNLAKKSGFTHLQIAGESKKNGTEND